MCGIAGIFSYNFAERRESMTDSIQAKIQRTLLAEILVAMETRGRDATGLAAVWEDGEVAVLKQPMQSSFVARNDGSWAKEYNNPKDSEANFRWFMETVGARSGISPLRQLIGHVRDGTKGSEYIVHNNHPIIIQDMVENVLEVKGHIPLSENALIGVHNGKINNDDKLFEKHGFNRIGEVDSEIIFHLLNQHKDDFTKENLEEVFNELDGAFSVLAFNASNPTKVAGLRKTRPMEIAFMPEIGSLIVVSDIKYLKEAIESYDRWRVRDWGEVYTEPESEEDLVLGTIGELFPDLTYDEYKSVPEGVFVLDLEEEVDDSSEAEKLVGIKRIYSTYTNYNYNNEYSPTRGAHSYVNNGVSGTTTTKSTTTPAAPAKPKVEDNRAAADTKEENVAAEVVDLSTYAESTENKEAIPLPAASNTTEDTEKTFELEIDEDGNAVPIEEEKRPESAEEEIDDSETICGVSFEDLKAVGSKSLIEEHLADNRLLMNAGSNGDVDLREELSKYSIDVDDDKHAAALMFAAYELVFPEGYACGFTDGYSAAEIESEGLHEGDNKRLEDLEFDIEAIKRARDEEGRDYKEKFGKLLSKAAKRTAVIGALRLMISVLLMDTGIVDKNGNINKRKYNGLLRRSGIVGGENPIGEDVLRTVHKISRNQ